MQKLLSIEVRGKQKSWSFNFYGDPSYLDEWREDGLDIAEVINTVPAWVPWWAVKAYIFMQDIFNFKR